ncbi:MAG: DNA replication/repair protein RecF, partial [Clostridiales bacterium]
MKLEQLRLQQYRSYEECTVAWHPRLNIITGQNAFGKTNLLEAIAYLSLGNSFRGGRDYELIQWEQPFFYLEAKVSTPFGLRKLSCGCDREKKKIWQLDGVAKKTFSPVAGVLKTVFFTPDDLWLVKSAPSYRRDFLNQQMIQLYPEYYLTWNRYQKALRQRNEMLKQCRGRLPEPELIAAWDESLAASGAFIIKKREEMVRQLTPLANQLQQAISGGKETISLEYQTILPAQEVEDLSKEGIQDELLAQLAAHLRDDLLRGVTTVGPQRDDLLISINGQTAKEYGSQGQQRTAALALKLSQVELVW